MNNMSVATQRDNYWDNLKGFLIISVVAGHLLGRLLLSSDKILAVYDIINNYHIPMFIFISGIFARKARSTPEKRASKMMLYYVIMQIVNWAVLHLFSCRTATKLTFIIPGYTFWYLPFMAVCIMLTYFMKSTKWQLWIPLSFAISLLSGFEPLGAEYSVARIVTFLPLFSVGYYIGADTDGFLKKLRTTKVRIATGLLTAAIFAITFIKVNDIPCSVYYGLGCYQVLYPNEPFYGLVARVAFFLSAGIIGVFFMSIFPKKKTILSFFGKNSLQIFLVHGMVIEVVWHILDGIPAFNSYEGITLLGQIAVAIKRYTVTTLAIAICCGAVILVKYALTKRKQQKAD